MSRRFDVVTFDCYGTLVDWEGGIAEAFLREASLHGVTLDRENLLAAYHAVEPAIERLPYRSYRDVLAQTAAEVAGRLGWKIAPERASFLAASLPLWRPFPDTTPALSELAANGYRLGILSNVDDDLIAETRRLLSASFDLVVTAQQVRSYKPGTAHFHEARDRIAGARWLHAAQSWFHDVAPACALGIPVAWINRKGESRPGGATPEVELADLAGLSAWLREAGQA
ncbi:MAG TPA: HAD-IA family hydrolase [Thermoanaerobaculia bacterium]|nr:HAD-IA family hydrolase [Thermoanaerobaculia bacterium]